MSETEHTDGTQIIWDDGTSYSQGQRGRVEQTAWETIIHGHRIWISSGHRYFPGSWVMICRSFDLVEVKVGNADMILADAQAKALALVVRSAKNRIDAAQEVIDAIAKATGERG